MNKRNEQLSVVCFGEVLWDVFPEHKKIGGAPLNVALRLKSFDVNSNIISRVGGDENGKALLSYISENNLGTSNIQIDSKNKTGAVNVTLDEKGSAFYEIEYPVAWDKIQVSHQSLELVKSSDAFIFGSLACRDEISKNTLLHFLDYAKFKVFDVNLRPPHYSLELLVDLMHKADFIKCNDDELNELCSSLGNESQSIEDQIQFISKYTKTQQICITKGGDGAILLYNDEFYDNKGYPVKVVDTVGAGDSFLASLMSKLLLNEPPIKVLNFACAVGAFVAGSEGANPTLNNARILNFIEKSNK